MRLFQCKHPAKQLQVKKDSTETIIDKDFIEVTHHLHCSWCNKDVDIKYAKLIGGVEGFLKRGVK